MPFLALSLLVLLFIHFIFGWALSSVASCGFSLVAETGAPPGCSAGFLIAATALAVERGL